MAITISKKGYAFSFLSLFLVILIYFYAGLQFDKDIFSSKNDIAEVRALSMNEEVTYFRDSYLIDIFEVSSYVAFDLLVEKSNQTSIYAIYRQNYTALNKLLEEMIVNGTLNGTLIPEMQPYTLSNLTQTYIENNRRDYFMNTSFIIHDFVIYEENPLTVNILTKVEFNFTSVDSVSSWNFNKTLETSFSIINIYDPSFYIIGDFGNVSPKIYPIEKYSANAQWDLHLFNITLQEQLSTIYYDPSFRYTIGNSFLRNLFNSTDGSYKNIFNFFSFDYDEAERSVYDTSQENFNSDFYGDSLLLVDFKNYSSIKDITSYNHSISTPNGIQNQSGCAWFSCIFFDSSLSQYVEIEDKGYFSNLTSFSSSFWFKFENKSEEQGLFSVGMNSTTENGFQIKLLPGLSGLEVSFRCDLNPVFSYNLASQNLTDSWNFIYADISIENQMSRLYLNGIIVESYEFPSSCTNFNLTQNIFLGSNSNSTDLFADGFFDELGVYSQTLSEDEIGSLYLSSKIKAVDYVDSLHGKGISFEDDYLNISLESPWDDFINNDFSLTLWVSPSLENGTLFTYDKKLSVGYNTSGILISDNNLTPNTFLFKDHSLIQNRFNHLVITKEGPNLEVYVNGKNSPTVIQVDGVSALSPSLINGDFTFGSASLPSEGVVSQNFNGILDEFVFLNKTLSYFEVEKQYFNFKSEVKGCCNYLTLFNPHIYGYNSSSYRVNTSYTSNMFFNRVFRGKTNNVTLYSLQNITSTSTDEEYFNFLVDNCMIRAYTLGGFHSNGSGLPTFRLGNDGLLDCKWLIRNGYY